MRTLIDDVFNVDSVASAGAAFRFSMRSLSSTNTSRAEGAASISRSAPRERRSRKRSGTFSRRSPTERRPPMESLRGDSAATRWRVVEGSVEAEVEGAVLDWSAVVEEPGRRCGRRPEFLPIIPIFNFGTTEYVDFSELVVFGVGSDLVYSGFGTGSAYPNAPGSYMSSFRVPAVSTLLNVIVLTKGPGSIVSELWCHDMNNRGFVGGPAPFTTPATPVAWITQVPPTNGKISIPVPSGNLVNS